MNRSLWKFALARRFPVQAPREGRGGERHQAAAIVALWNPGMLRVGKDLKDVSFQPSQLVVVHPKPRLSSGEGMQPLPRQAGPTQHSRSIPPEQPFMLAFGKYSTFFLSSTTANPFGR